MHQSFAEFFLAKNSFIKIGQNKDNDQEFKEIFRDERHFLIRRFLNDLMAKEELIKRNSQTNEDYNKEIENCCKENLIFLLKYFLEIKEAHIKAENEFLIGASLNGHIEIIKILIEHKEVNINQKDKSGYTALHWASRNGHKEIVKLLLTEQKEILYALHRVYPPTF